MNPNWKKLKYLKNNFFHDFLQKLYFEQQEYSPYSSAWAQIGANADVLARPCMALNGSEKCQKQLTLKSDTSFLRYPNIQLVHFKMIISACSTIRIINQSHKRSVHMCTITATNQEEGGTHPIQSGSGMGIGTQQNCLSQDPTKVKPNFKNVCKHYRNGNCKQLTPRIYRIFQRQTGDLTKWTSDQKIVDS